MKNFFLILSFVFISSFAQDNSNQLDANGKKHGAWKGFYEESKRPRYEGVFEHGKEIGMFKYFDDTKDQVVIATREFSKKDNSAFTIFYDQKKNKISEGKVVDKLREGSWKYYHEASKIVMTLENYVKGKLEGNRKIFFPSGKLAEESNYKNNVRQGAYKKYTENGIVLEETTYLNGEFHGQTIYRDPLGNIVAKGVYKNGKKKGIWQFFENGKLVSEENMSLYRKAKKAAVKKSNQDTLKVK